MKDLKKGQICDSIVQNQQLQIINFKSVLQKDSLIISENNKRITQLKKDIKFANLKLKISKRFSFIGIPVAITGGFLIGLVLK